ncbi:hypothetical protein H4R35_003134 [Dimargaris xerosporica]|nr:hypothetical protein H4R35_003134 [Dimargaris xerosporica]
MAQALPVILPYSHQPSTVDGTGETSDAGPSLMGIYPHAAAKDQAPAPKPLPAVPEPEPLPLPVPAPEPLLPAPPAPVGYMPNLLDPYTPGLPNGENALPEAQDSDGLSPPGVPEKVDAVEGNEEEEAVDGDSGTDDDGDGDSDSDHGSDSDDDDGSEGEDDDGNADHGHNTGEQDQDHHLPKDITPTDPKINAHYNPENLGQGLSIVPNLDIPSALGLHGRRQLRRRQRRADGASASRDQALIKGPVVGIGIDLQPQQGLGGLLKLNLSLLGLLHINVDTYSLFGYDKNHRLVHQESHRGRGKSTGYDDGLKVDLDEAKQEEEHVDSVVAVIKGTDGTEYVGKLPYLGKSRSTPKKSDNKDKKQATPPAAATAKPIPGKSD